MPPRTAATPRVTVVMAVYNAAPYLGEAIASVLSQTYRDFELVVVDDASTDGSLAILESLDDPRIRIVTHSNNQGASETRNEAIVAARGELIAIMDADDVCAPTRLEQQVAFLDTHPEAGLVGCGIYDNVDASGAVLYTSVLPEENDAIQLALMETWCFLHSSITFRKALHASAGGYRTAFEPVEDHDFVLRVVEQAQACNHGERLVTYRLNPGGLSVTGHQYIDELRAIAIGLARRRRSGQPEDLDGVMPRVLELKRRRKAIRGLGGIVQRWRDSFYAAHRYYGFGCRELCAGRLDSARRCFVQSLLTNWMFVKSWFGCALSLWPFAAHRLRFLFRSSMQQHNHPGWSRPRADAHSARLSPVAHGTPASSTRS